MIFEGMTLDDLRSHCYMIGATRSGKTNALMVIMDYLFSEQVQKKMPCSIVFIDPHGDAALELAMRIDPLDRERVLLFDPRYTPFGLNPLELPPDVSSAKDRTREEKAMLVQTQVDEMLTVLKELFGTDVKEAPRLIWIFRGALYFLYQFSDSPSFKDLHFLLTDMLKRDESGIGTLLRTSKVQEDIMSKTIEAISKLQADAFMAVINRISNFVLPADALTPRIFCAEATTVPFGEMLKPGRLSIFRLSRFYLPDNFRTLVTNSIILRLYFMIQERARELERSGMTSGARTPVFLVIDEFQNAIQMEIFQTIVSEAAKFGLYIIMAHQNISQIPDRLFETVTGNVGNIISFRLNAEDAQRVAKLLSPRDEKLPGFLAGMANWECVMRKNPVGSSGILRTYRVEVPLVHPPVRDVEAVFKFMKNEMAEYAGVYDSKKEPAYRRETTSYLAMLGLPQETPVAWAILCMLYREGPGPKDVKWVKAALYSANKWDSNLVQGEINALNDKGLIRVHVREGLFQGREPENEDEKVRSRVTYAEITGKAVGVYFSREIHGNRTGDAIHHSLISDELKRYWDLGWYTIVDYGEYNAERPDILVYKTIPDREADIVGAVDPVNWCDTPTAVEVETYPSKSAEQVLKNYEKNTGRNILFVVDSEENEKEIRRILGEDRKYNVRVNPREELAKGEGKGESAAPPPPTAPGPLDGGHEKAKERPPVTDDAYTAGLAAFLKTNQEKWEGKCGILLPSLVPFAEAARAAAMVPIDFNPIKRAYEESASASVKAPPKPLREATEWAAGMMAAGKDGEEVLDALRDSGWSMEEAYLIKETLNFAGIRGQEKERVPVAQNLKFPRNMVFDDMKERGAKERVYFPQIREIEMSKGVPDGYVLEAWKAYLKSRGELDRLALKDLPPTPTSAPSLHQPQPQVQAGEKTIGGEGRSGESPPAQAQQQAGQQRPATTSTTDAATAAAQAEAPAAVSQPAKPKQPFQEKLSEVDMEMEKLFGGEEKEKQRGIPEPERKVRESILEKLEGDPSTPVHTLTEITGVSDRQVQEYLDQMVDEGVLVRKGSFYEIRSLRI